MKSKTMVLMAIAVVCGLVASYMTSQLLSQQKKEIDVYIAAKDFNQWTPLQKPDEMFVKVTKPEKDAPQNAVRSIDELKNKVLLKAIKKDGIISREMLLDKEKSGMDAQITAGKRAISIMTRDADAVGGFIMPGTYVDVIYTKKPTTPTGKPVSVFVLQNALVRAVGLLTNKPEDKIGMPVANVTLELDPKQALDLMNYKDLPLTFVLRSFGDDKEIEVDEAAVEKATPPPPPPPAALAAKIPGMKPKGDSRTMTTFNGQAWVVEVFEKVNGVWTITQRISSTAPQGDPSEKKPTEKPKAKPKVEGTEKVPEGEPAPMDK